MDRALPRPLLLSLPVWPITWVAAFTFGLLRRPEIVTRPEFYGEGLPVFYMPTYFVEPLELVFTPYAGYLHIGPRLIAYVERLVDPAFAPAIGGLVALAIVAAIATFVASDRLAVVFPQRWQRLGLAAAIVFSPSVYETMGVDVQIQNFGALYLIALALARPPQSRTGHVVDGATALLAALTGPYGLLLLPVFLFLRSRLSIAVGIGSAAQLVTVLASTHRSMEIPELSTVVAVVALRVNAAVVGPSLASVLPAATALVLGGLLIVVATESRSRTWIVFAYLVLVVGAISIAAEGVALAEWPRLGERTFILAAVLVAVLALSSTRRPARLLLAIVVVGVLVDLRIPALPGANWKQESACIGAEDPCYVRTYPARFSAMWPGADGEYEPRATFWE